MTNTIVKGATVRWGIIGCGNVTEIKSGPAFQLAGRSQLVAVMRRQASLAADYARRHGVGRWYADAAQLIDDPEVDAVYVATPVGDHCSLALAVCEAGKPCYVEKPMARNHRECQTMVEAFAHKKLPLFVAYYRRGLRRFLKVRELVQSGVLGEIETVTVRFSYPTDNRVCREALPWRLKAEEAGGGLFLDLGSHTLDILDFILGPLDFIRGDAVRRSSEYDVEDAVDLEFSALNGRVKGDARWDFRAATHSDLIRIAGSRGCVSLSTFGNEAVRWESATGAVACFELPNPRHIQQPLIQSIVDELRGKGAAPSTGRSAARTARLMDQVLDRFYAGREDEFWKRPQTWGNAQQR